MIVLDTDTLTLLMKGHARIANRMEQAEEVAITIVTRIEVLQGRFASILKAADGAELWQAQQRLDETERYIHVVPIIPFDTAAVAAFEKLLVNKKLKKIGRADLLISSITLANRATLVTRNLQHFGQVPGLHLENWAD